MPLIQKKSRFSFRHRTVLQDKSPICKCADYTSRWVREGIEWIVVVCSTLLDKNVAKCDIDTQWNGCERDEEKKVQISSLVFTCLFYWFQFWLWLIAQHFSSHWFIAALSWFICNHFETNHNSICWLHVNILFGIY